MFRYTKIALAVAAFATAGAGVFAYADDIGANDVIAFTAAKITMTQAITVAETLVGGKAHNAEFKRVKVLGVAVPGTYAYNVEVLVAGVRVFDVKVDANSGAVLSSVEDLPDAAGKDDGDGDGDKKD